jgi:hypothetical protein
MRRNIDDNQTLARARHLQCFRTVLAEKSFPRVGYTPPALVEVHIIRKF